MAPGVPIFVVKFIINLVALQRISGNLAAVLDRGVDDTHCQKLCLLSMAEKVLARRFSSAPQLNIKFIE